MFSGCPSVRTAVVCSHVPASTGKEKAGMVVGGWTRGVQVKRWDPLRMSAIPERLRGVFTTKCYTNLYLYFYLTAWRWHDSRIGGILMMKHGINIHHVTEHCLKGFQGHGVTGSDAGSDGHRNPCKLDTFCTTERIWKKTYPNAHCRRETCSKITVTDVAEDILVHYVCVRLSRFGEPFNAR